MKKTLLNQGFGGLQKKVDPRLATRAFMGEEKPDEELMGKRKSSPRLSPTPLGAGIFIVGLAGRKYTQQQKKFNKSLVFIDDKS
jgi:hypothetical protein